MITRRNALWLIPFLLLLTFPVWKIPVAAFLSPRGGFDQDAPVNQNQYDFAMSGVTIRQSDKGKITAIIRADSAHSSKFPNEYILERVNADIFDKKGAITNIVAEIGNYNTQTEHLKLIDSVVITNTGDNYSLKTELLRYDGRKRTVFCPGDTLLEGDGITIEGKSFAHDMNTGVYTVGGRVHCLLQGLENS